MRPQKARQVECLACGDQRTVYGKGRFSSLCDACRPLYRKRYAILSRYKGFSLRDFREMLHTQDERCAICRAVKPLAIDHDHETGRVRALLCVKCNTGLGAFRDDRILLEQAMQYLALHGR